jgi:hypothetical protein
MKAAKTSKTGRNVRWLAILALPLAVLLSEAAAWWWMNPASQRKESVVLAYRFPGERPGYLTQPLKPGIVDVLKCDAGQVGLIAAGRGGVLEVSYFEWDGTDETGLMEAFAHSPDVCMGVTGSKLEAHLPSRTFQLGNQNLVFDVTRFQHPKAGPILIFKAPWAEGMSGVNLLREGPRGESVRRFKFVAVAQRWKPRFARVLMAGVTGVTDEDEAWRIVRERVLVDLELQTRAHGQ